LALLATNVFDLGNTFENPDTEDARKIVDAAMESFILT